MTALRDCAAAVPTATNRTTRAVSPLSATACRAHGTSDRPSGSPNRMLTVLCRMANIRRVRVHDLRHTCAWLLLAEGVDARTLMETLGHSTVTLTLDTSAHVRDTTLRAATDRMDAALDMGEYNEEEEGVDGRSGPLG